MTMPNFKTFIKRGKEQIEKHGLSLLFWRYIYKYLILTAEKVYLDPSAATEVHMQVCRRDWVNGMWTLYSLAKQIQLPFRCVLLHDGWLDSNPMAAKIYKNKFPGITTYTKKSVKIDGAHIIESSPKIEEMWNSKGEFPTISKVIDSYVKAKNDFVIQIDPDILFFDYPKEIIEDHLDDGKVAVWNYVDWRRPDPDDPKGTYCYSPREVRKLTGLQLPLPFSTGLGKVDIKRTDWRLASKVIDNTEIISSNKWTIDQTIHGLMAAKYGYKKLPTEKYAIRPVDNIKGIVARHYFGKTRDLMYVKGLKSLHERGLTPLSRYRPS